MPGMRDILPGFLRPKPALFRQLVADYGLKKRRRGSPTRRTPPYAGCYNIPDHWWEGDILGHVVTFRGEFTEDRFTGDIMVGPFDGYTHGSCWRDEDNGRTGEHVKYGSRHKDQPEIAAITACLAAHPAITEIRFGFDGVQIEVKDAPGAVLRELLGLAPGAVDAMIRLKAEPPALLTAAAAGDLKTVEALLAQGADPDAYASDHVAYGGKPPRTLNPCPIHEAIRRDDAAMVRLLAPCTNHFRREATSGYWESTGTHVGIRPPFRTPAAGASGRRGRRVGRPRSSWR